MLNQRKDEKKCSKWIICSIVAAFAVSGLLFICYLIYKAQSKPPESSQNEICEDVGVKAVSDAENMHRRSLKSSNPSPIEFCKDVGVKLVHGSLIIVNGVHYQLEKEISTNVWMDKKGKKIIKEMDDKIFVYDWAEYEANTCFIEGIKNDCTVTVFDESASKYRTFVLESNLGVGSFGDVWEAHESDGSQNVGVKFSKTLDIGIFEDESKVTKRIHQLLGDNGDKTVQCIGNVKTNYPDNGHKDDAGEWIHISRIMDVIVMELFDTDARKHFVTKTKGKDKDALEITKRITNVAQVMWSNGLIAHDIKLENIFLKLKADGGVSVSVLGDYGTVIDKNKLTMENLKYYHYGGTWFSPFDELIRDGKPEFLAIAKNPEKRDKLIESDVVFDINNTLAIAWMLCLKQHQLTKKFLSLTEKNTTEQREQFRSNIKDCVKHIEDKEKFTEGKRKISMEELMVWTHWMLLQKTEDVGNEKYMITLDEYAKLTDRVDLMHENRPLNQELGYSVSDDASKNNSVALIIVAAALLVLAIVFATIMLRKKIKKVKQIRETNQAQKDQDGNSMSELSSCRDEADLM